MTTRELLRGSDSFFSGLENQLSPDVDTVFVDRDPTHFRYILNWMRGVTVLPEDDQTLRELEAEADYFGLHTLVGQARRSPRRYSMLKLLKEIRDDLRRNVG